MSRSKKSRKPGSAPTAKPKLSKEELASVEKRVRKKKGKKPGNRQQEAQPSKNTEEVNQKNKDPRIGSKTLIALGGSNTQAASKPPAAKSTRVKKSTPIAAIRYAEPAQVLSQNIEQNFEQELANIEADEKLQTILAKQEDDIALTEQEVHYYNEMMERHQALTEQLGINDEENDEDIISPSKSSEDDLWNKLDNADDDFSQF
ncbi:MAG: GTPase-activating protein [Colwellia sp.]|nr:GTPase-activating protein [Colwellia sp.]